MTFGKFINELNGHGVEGELIKTFIYGIITSAVVFTIAWFTSLRNIENFLFDKAYFLFFAILSYSILLPAIRQIRSYKELPCMPGMMVGMVLGSLAGFLAGFFVASTNGMFIGSVFGMMVGIYFGTWLGSCCGVMGFLEGIMAGFMGGLMGAMTSFMLLNDNLRIAAIIVFIISVIIIIGINYMVYKEMHQNERKRKEDNFWTIILAFILTLITIWIMAFGPRSGVFG